MRLPAILSAHIGHYGLKHNGFRIPVDSQKKNPVAGDAPRFARQHTQIARKDP
jgi:hypothetical protein